MRATRVGAMERAHVVTLEAKYMVRCARPDATEGDRQFLARLQGRLAELDAKQSAMNASLYLDTARGLYPECAWTVLDWPGGPFLSGRMDLPKGEVGMYAEMRGDPTQLAARIARMLPRLRPLPETRLPLFEALVQGEAKRDLDNRSVYGEANLSAGAWYVAEPQPTTAIAVEASETVEGVPTL